MKALKRFDDFDAIVLKIESVNLFVSKAKLSLVNLNSNLILISCKCLRKKVTFERKLQAISYSIKCLCLT